MPRKGNNIYKRADGRWEGRIRKENVLPGEAKYRYVYAKTYSELKEKMDMVKQSMKKNCCSFTMKEAADLWLTEKQEGLKATTYAAYSNLTEKYIIPVLGSCKISDIDDLTLKAFTDKIRYREDGKRLSDSYLHTICSVVVMVMSHMKTKHHFAVEIPDNPVLPDRKSAMILPGDHDLKKIEEYLFSHMSEDGTSLGILTSLYTGIRIGELCGLTWENINLNDEVIYIRQSIQRSRTSDGEKNNTEIIFQMPKTASSEREIPIPPILLPLFKEQQGEASDFLIKGKKKPFAEPRTVEYRFARILNECSVKQFHFHMLRHAFASRCIVRGFDAKSLSELLGHSSVQTTLKLYVHSSMQHKKELMNLFHFPEKGEKAISL